MRSAAVGPCGILDVCGQFGWPFRRPRQQQQQTRRRASRKVAAARPWQLQIQRRHAGRRWCRGRDFGFTRRCAIDAAGCGSGFGGGRHRLGRRRCMCCRRDVDGHRGRCRRHDHFVRRWRHDRFERDWRACQRWRRRQWCELRLRDCRRCGHLRRGLRCRGRRRRRNDRLGKWRRGRLFWRWRRGRPQWWRWRFDDRLCRCGRPRRFVNRCDRRRRWQRQLGSAKLGCHCAGRQRDGRRIGCLGRGLRLRLDRTRCRLLDDRCRRDRLANAAHTAAVTRMRWRDRRGRSGRLGTRRVVTPQRDGQTAGHARSGSCVTAGHIADPDDQQQMHKRCQQQTFVQRASLGGARRPRRFAAAAAQPRRCPRGQVRADTNERRAHQRSSMQAHERFSAPAAARRYAAFP